MTRSISACPLRLPNQFNVISVSMYRGGYSILILIVIINAE